MTFSMIFFITLGVLALFLVFMAAGVLMGRAPLKGSCGGVGKLMGKDCDFCKNKDKCQREEGEAS